MKPIILSIDGNIGAGKTTFLNNLKKENPTWHFIDEPVDIWTQFSNEDGESLLEVFYKDKKRWSYSFQNCVFLTRITQIIKVIQKWKDLCILNPEESKNNIFITERCVDTDFNIFAKMLHDDGFINKMEWDIYKQWHSYLSIENKISGIIYITCSPEKCQERIGIRNRTGENNISLEYLTKLHKYHEEWIDNTSIPVVNINTENDINNSSSDFDNFKKRIF